MADAILYVDHDLAHRRTTGKVTVTLTMGRIRFFLHYPGAIDPEELAYDLAEKIVLRGPDAVVFDAVGVGFVLLEYVKFHIWETYGRREIRVDPLRTELSGQRAFAQQGQPR